MNMVKTCILLVGPESSGTRWLGGVFGEHPDVHGPSGGHSDPLDFYWRDPEINPFENGRLTFSTVLTRRSLPSASCEDTAANYMEFPDLFLLEEHCQKSHVSLKVLIVTRSPEANISSWSNSRASAGGSRTKATKQYQSAYRYILRWLDRSDSPAFWFLSFEAVLFEGNQYLNSIFRLLELRAFDTSIASNYAVNHQHYLTESTRAVASFSIGEIIYLRNGSKGLVTLGSGWAAPETKYTWSVNGYSILRVALKGMLMPIKENEEFELHLALQPYVFAEKLPSQQLSLSVGGQVVYTGNHTSCTSIVARFPSSLISDSGIIEIAISSPTAISPSSIDPASSELKRISVAVIQYSINYAQAC